MKYIVMDTVDNASVGMTLEEAFRSYKVEHDQDNEEDLTVYEAEEIEVEFKVVKKTKPIKVINKPEGKKP